MTSQGKKHVAFLDVLGFSELIFQNPGSFAEKFRRYTATIAGSIREVDNAFEYKVFSDTILILSNDDSFQELIKLIQIVSYVLFDLTHNQHIPIKGSISTGDIIEMKEEKESILAGKPIIEAYNYEQQQNWLGIILAPSVISKYPDIDLKVQPNLKLHFEESIDSLIKDRTLAISLIQYDRIPLRESDDPTTAIVNSLENRNYFTGFAVIPHSMSSKYPEHVREDLLEYIKTLRVLLLQGKNISIQSKYKATIEFISLCSSSCSAIADNYMWRTKLYEKDGFGQPTIAPKRMN
jgi:hypothetical protein